MAFLTLGGSTIEVQHGSATEDAPTYIGEAARAFSGLYRSGVRAAKRQWSFAVIPQLAAGDTSLRTLIGLDVQLTANGDFNGGTAVTVVARLGADQFIPDGLGFQRVAALTIIEV